MVDDEAGIRGSVRRLLERHGYTVFMAEEAGHGLALLSERDIDLVLCDYDMPRVDGPTFLKQVATQFPHACRILMSGRSGLHAVGNADGEIDCAVEKPWDDAAFVSLIDFALGRRTAEQRGHRVMSMLRSQTKFLRDLERKIPGVAAAVRDAENAVIFNEDELKLLERQAPARKQRVLPLGNAGSAA